MVRLNQRDLLYLIDILTAMPQMQGAEGRRTLLLQAGLEKLIPRINLSGDADTFVTTTITDLANYGQISYENEALGQFLNTMKLVGKLGLEHQRKLDEILEKYRMVPAADEPELADWKSGDSDEDVLEKIFRENTLRPVAFLEQGLQAARAVVYVGVTASGKAWMGTGFMAAPNLALTNHHVIPEAGLLGGVRVRFNYQQDLWGRDLCYEEHPARPDGLFRANEKLDYALFEVEGTPGAAHAWGHLPLQCRDVRPGERINIVQHPGGQPKQISIQNNRVKYVGGHVLQYVTSTLPGSSGSPVFNDRWEVVGLHHAGGSLTEPTTGSPVRRNEAILLSDILEDLPPDVRRQVEQADRVEAGRTR